MAMTLITTNTSSNAATSDFTSSIDSTYKLYIFKFYDVNPATDDVKFSVQFNVAGQSGFNETITTTAFRAIHNEADSEAALAYQTGGDQAQGTAYQSIVSGVGNASDESCSGVMHLFNPASTTYAKHFYSRASIVEASPSANDIYAAGYINTTSAIDEIDFKMSSGNFDGLIQMYGIA